MSYTITRQATQENSTTVSYAHVVGVSVLVWTNEMHHAEQFKTAESACMALSKSQLKLTGGSYSYKVWPSMVLRVETMTDI